MKRCSKCRKIKQLDQFYANSRRKDGKDNYCKNCKKQQVKKATDPEKIKEYSKHYYEKNRDKLIARSSEYGRKRSARDPEFRLRQRLRSRLNKALHQNNKAGSAVRDLGCSIEELRTYLESLFQEGMSWDNYGRKGWHIDHVIPLSRFDLTKRRQFKKAVHYTNLQPLWAKDNLVKSDKT